MSKNGDKVVVTNKKTGEKRNATIIHTRTADSGWGGCSVEHTVKYNDGTTEQLAGSEYAASFSDKTITYVNAVGVGGATTKRGSLDYDDDGNPVPTLEEAYQEYLKRHPEDR